MSRITPEDLAEILQDILAKTRSELLLAKVDSIQASDYTASLTFFEPKDLSDLSLEKVTIMRTGAGFMPAVGDEVVVGFIGIEHPVIMGIYRQASWAGMSTGKEWTLGDSQNIIIKEDKTILVQNDAIKLELDPQGGIKITGSMGKLEIDSTGKVSLGNDIADLKKLINRIATMFTKMGPVVFAPGASFAPILADDLVQIQLEIASFLK